MNFYKIYLALSIICLARYASHAQTDEVNAKGSNESIAFSAFLDLYYGYDLNRPDRQQRLPFLYNHNRHQQLGVNLALVKASFTHDRLDVNLALHAGTYVQDNYSQEPTALSYINEANISYRYHDKWILDAGIMPSYIGWESAISKDNLTLSRSLVAENSPYFMTGVATRYTPNDHWSIGVGLYNGWQRIQPIYGVSIPSIGTQIVYNRDRLTINHSSYFGKERQQRSELWRIYNNLFLKTKINKIQLIIGFDYGVQQDIADASKYYSWYTPTFITSYKKNDKMQLGFRIELFSDKNNIVIPKISNTSGDIFGLSMNLDYYILPQLLWRNEWRYLSSDEIIFPISNSDYSASNIFLLSSISYTFSK